MLGRDYAVLLVFAGENEGSEPCGAELLQYRAAAAPLCLGAVARAFSGSVSLKGTPL